MSKLRKKIEFLFLALFPILMGCSADDSLVLLPDEQEEESMEIQLLATTSAQADAIITRIGDNGFEIGDKLGVYSEELFENTLFTLEEDYFIAEETCHFPLGKERLTLSAYYPYSETIADNLLPVKNNVVYVDNPAWTNATSDPLWATNTIEEPTRNQDEQTTDIIVPLNFKHQLARLQLKTDEDVQIKNIVITFNDTQYGYMDIATGEITSVQPDAQQSITWIMASIENGTNTSTGINIDGLFLPNEDAIASIKVNLDGIQKEIFPTDAINHIELKSGTITTIKISKGSNAATRSNNEICLNIEE